MRKLNTGDCFALVRLINECGVKETLSTEIKDLLDGRKLIISADDGSQSLTDDGMGVIYALISAFGKKGAELAFYEFLSGPFELTPKQIEELPPMETLQMIKTLASPNEWKDFFGSAVRLDKMN